MTLDLDTLLSFFGPIMSIGTLIYAFFATRQSKNDARFKAGSDRMDRHEARLQSLEQTVQGMPDRSALHDLELQITAITGELKVISATIRANQEIMQRQEIVVQRLEEHLLSSGK